MTLFGKLAHKFKAMGSKVAGAASYLGHKTAGVLAAFAPAVAAFNPAVGAGMVGAAGVAAGVGALGDVGKSMLSGVKPDATHFNQAKAAVGDMRGGMRAVKSAYNSSMNRSALERP